MVFSSLTFLYLFLPAVFLLYFLLPAKCRNIVLLIASLAFYFYGEQGYLLMMLGVILITYLAGLLLERLHRKIRTAVLVLFLICDLGLLAVFKYAGLFAASINTLAGSDILHMIQPAMPIGISFYMRW